MTGIARADRSEPLRLSWPQQQLWLLHQGANTSAAYHIPTAVRLLGHLDTDALVASLDALVERHESSRTVFVNDRGVCARGLSPAAGPSVCVGMT